MSDKKRFDIPVIATVECDDIDEARQAVYKALQAVSFKDFRGGRGADATPIDLELANDDDNDVENQRVVRLHPEDTHTDYDKGEYMAKLVDNE